MSAGSAGLGLQRTFEDLMRAIAFLLAGLVAAALASCASVQPLPPPPVHANGGALWRIISTQCLPGQRERHDPSPCAEVSLEGGPAHGFVLLKDRNGVAQHLLMPTAKITGIEDPAILAPDAANYFEDAWNERQAVAGRLGRRLDRTELSVAVNSIYGRSQDQLHLHIDCVDKAVAAVLHRLALPHDGAWAAHTVALKGHSYRVRWLEGDRLASANPFRLLAQSFPDARREMGAWTIAIVGAVAPGGEPGFYLLADRVDPASGDRASAEELQDHACGG
jgi:CDP-diacylglycerol pyrophosphatase